MRLVEIGPRTGDREGRQEPAISPLPMDGVGIGESYLGWQARGRYLCSPAPGCPVRLRLEGNGDILA